MKWVVHSTLAVEEIRARKGIWIKRKGQDWDSGKVHEVKEDIC